MNLITQMLEREADGLLNAFGEPVTFIPKGGTGLEAVALINRIADHGGSLNARQWLVEIHKSEIEKPAHGDTVLIDGETFTVNETGKTRVSSDGVFWKMPVIDGEQSAFRGRR